MSQTVAIADYQGTPQQLLGQFIPTNFGAVTLNSASGTTAQPIVTAPAGKFIFVTGIQITIDPICTIAVAGMVNMALTDSVFGNIATLRVYIPSTPGAPTVPTVIRQTSAPGAFWPAPQAASTLSASLNVALTAGSIRVSFHYGLTSKLIGNN